MTDADVWLNKLLSHFRLRVEHTLPGVKPNRSVNEVLRNTKQGYSDLLMVIACALHNWRLAHRHPVPTFNLLTLAHSPNFG